MDYFDLIKGSTGPKEDKHELTFGDLLSECRESAKEKVSEQDYKEDNEELNKDETPELKDPSKDPDSDVPPPPDVVKDNDTPMEMRKEYLGKSDETHYYFITTEGGTGDIDDLVIADQDGTKKYSAKEQDIEISEENIADFLIAAIRDIMISSIERSIFLKYIYPKLIEEEPEVEEELPDEEVEELPEEPGKEKAPEEARPPRESVVHEAKVDESGIVEMDARDVPTKVFVDGKPITDWIKNSDAKSIALLLKKAGMGDEERTTFEIDRDVVLSESKVDEQVINLDKLGDDELVAKYEELQSKVDSGGMDSRVKIKLNTMAEEIKKRGLDIGEKKVDEGRGEEIYQEALEFSKKEILSQMDARSGDYDEFGIRDRLVKEFGITKQEAEDIMMDAAGADELDLGTQPNFESIEESKAHLFELKVTDDKENTFDVFLMDDDDEDTTIDINGMEHTFSQYSEYFRDKEGKLTEEGLKELALDVLANLPEEDYNELAARAGEEETRKGEVESDVAYAHNPQTETKNESKEDNKGNDMLNEKTVEGLIKDAERAEAKAKAFRKQAAEVKKAGAKKEADAKVEVKAKEAAAKKKAKESVESEETKTEIKETDVAKGAKALIKLAKDALKDGRYSEAAEHSQKLAEIEAVIPAEAAEEAEKITDEPEVPAEEPDEELDVEKSEEVAEDVVPKEDEVVKEDAAVEDEVKEEEAVKEDTVEEEVTDEKKAKPVCKKCNKAHWPFEKCPKAKKESKIGVESIMDVNETKQLQRLRDLLGG